MGGFSADEARGLDAAEIHLHGNGKSSLVLDKTKDQDRKAVIIRADKHTLWDFDDGTGAPAHTPNAGKDSTWGVVELEVHGLHQHKKPMEFLCVVSEMNSPE